MCLCQQANLKVGDKVRWNKLDFNPQLKQSFLRFYTDEVYTVRSIDHIGSGWKNVLESTCFVRFVELVGAGGGGWGFQELNIVKKRKLKVKLP